MNSRFYSRAGSIRENTVHKFDNNIFFDMLGLIISLVESENSCSIIFGAYHWKDEKGKNNLKQKQLSHSINRPVQE